MGAEVLSLDLHAPAINWYKIYAMTPPRAHMGKFGRPRLIEGSVAVFSCPQRAIGAYLQLIKEQTWGDGSGFGGSKCTMVYLSVQDTPDAKARGSIIYCSNLANKEKGRIHENEKRLVLPATRTYGKLVERTWPWWPSWEEGLIECVAAGDITQEQADEVSARLGP